jgi:quercetin dioxygenase-like cupin family protein
VDLETRSTWNAYGLALEGPMKGTQLEPVILVSQFWFAWSQFRPGTRVFTANSAQAAAPAPIVAWQVLEQVPATENQEASLLRITLPPGARSEPHSQQGRGLVYVVQGSVDSVTATNEPRTYGAGETLVQPAFGPVLTFRNAGGEPATLLLYHVGPKVK